MPVSAMATEVLLAEAVPTTVGSTPGLTANTNPSNTPGATGLLAPPQSPSGAVVTNTGRSSMAAATFTAKLNPAGIAGWNGVRTPTNPV